MAKSKYSLPALQPSKLHHGAVLSDRNKTRNVETTVETITGNVAPNEKLGRRRPRRCSESLVPSSKVLGPLDQRGNYRSVRSAPASSTHCQEERVNDWLVKNKIQVHRIPKLDHEILTKRRSLESGYALDVVGAPVFQEKLINLHTEKRNPLQGNIKEPCERLIRTEHNFKKPPLPGRDSVVRVGGGYKQLCWKAEFLSLDNESILPQVICKWCLRYIRCIINEQITESGRIKTVLSLPSHCDNCGEEVGDDVIPEKNESGVVLETVEDTLKRGDPRFVIDHRRPERATEKKSKQFPTKVKSTKSRKEKSEKDKETDVFYRDDMDVFLKHMNSLETLEEQDFELEMDTNEEITRTAFLTEETPRDQGVEPPYEMRHAWDDETCAMNAEIIHDLQNDTKQGGPRIEQGGHYRNIHSAPPGGRKQYEIIQEDDVDSGIKVFVKRKTNHEDGSTANTDISTSNRTTEQQYVDKQNRLRCASADHEQTDGKSSHRSRDPTGSQIPSSGVRTNNNSRFDPHREKYKFAGDNTKARNQGTFMFGGKHKDPKLESHKGTSVPSEYLDDQGMVIYIPVGEVTKIEHGFLDNDATSECSSDEERENERFLSSGLSPSKDKQVVGSPSRDRHRKPRRKKSDVTSQRSEHDVPLDEGEALDEQYLYDSSSDYSSGQVFRRRGEGYMADTEEDRVDTVSDEMVYSNDEDNLENLQQRLRRIKMNTKTGLDKHDHVFLEESQEDLNLDNQSDVMEVDMQPAKKPLFDFDIGDSDSSLHPEALSDLTDSETDQDSQGEMEGNTKHAREVLSPNAKSGKDSTRINTTSPRRIIRVPSEDSEEREAGRRVHGHSKSPALGYQAGQRKHSASHQNKDKIPQTWKNTNKVPQGGYIPRPPRRKIIDEDAVTMDDFLQTPSPGHEQSFDVKPARARCRGLSCPVCGNALSECEGVCNQCGSSWYGHPCPECQNSQVCTRCGKLQVRCESAEEWDSDRVSGQSSPCDDIDDLSENDADGEESTWGENPNKHQNLDRGQGEVDNTTREHSVSERQDGVNKEAKRRKQQAKKGRDPRQARNIHIDRSSTSRAENMDTTESITSYSMSSPVTEEQEDFDQELTSDLSAPSTSSGRQMDSRRSTRQTTGTAPGRQAKRVIGQRVVNRTSTKNQQETPLNIPPEQELTAVQEYADDQEDVLDMAEFFKGKNKTQVEQEQIGEGECDGGKRQGKDRDDENKPTNGELTKEADKNDVKESEDAQREKEEQEKAEENKEPPKPKLRGVKRVNEAFKERPELLSRLKNIMHFAKGNVIGEADMQVRRESVIDYLSQYRLVEDGKIEVYARTFALEDEDDDGIINFGQMKLCLEGVPGLMGMSRKQLNFVLQVLELSSSSRFTFKLYAVVAGLCERVALLSPLIKDYVEGMDLQAIERRMDIYKDMFYVNGDYSRTSITEDDLRIELKAGGLSQQQEDLVVDTIGPNQFKEISFLQYMAYLPLFLSIHENICKNALDMSRDKYLKKKSHVNET